MPIAAPPWTEFLSCPVCCNEFDSGSRGPISLPCCHTICRACLANLHKRQCPFDQTELKSDVNSLPLNGALVELACGSSGSGAGISGNNDICGSVAVPPSILAAGDAEAWLAATNAVRRLAMHLRPTTSTAATGSSVTASANTSAPTAPPLSRSMQRKLVTLVNCQLAEPEGRDRAMRAARSLGDRTVTELILHHQNPQHLSANLWAAVRSRGCQFLGPAMQEEVLKLVLLALEDGSALSRKVLVMFVVQRLEPHFPQASKTSIGHVVQLLYRASSFKVSKREGDSSLMQLKEEFRNYESLRREHDAQIVQIATEAGLRIAPDQWSALLYGDAQHKSHMQSIVDKLQTPAAFAHSIDELLIALQRTQDPGRLSLLRPHLDFLASIDPGPGGGEGGGGLGGGSGTSGGYSMVEVARGMEACRAVVTGLVEFMRTHGAATKGGGQPVDHHHHHHQTTSGGSLLSGPSNCSGSSSTVSSISGQQAAAAAALVAATSSSFRYKVSLCRDFSIKGTCPRGHSCTFAHSNDELDKFRAKNRAKAQLVRNINKEDDLLTDSIYFPNDVTDLSSCEFNQQIYGSVGGNIGGAGGSQSFHHQYQHPPVTHYVSSPGSISASHYPPHHSFSGSSVSPHQILGCNQHQQQQNHMGTGYQSDQLHAAYSPQENFGSINIKQKQLLWRSHSLPNNKGTMAAKVAVNWAVLQHRRQELLNQLERVVARCNNNIIPNDSLDVNNCQQQPGGNFNQWPSVSGTNGNYQQQSGGGCMSSLDQGGGTTMPQFIKGGGGVTGTNQHPPLAHHHHLHPRLHHLQPYAARVESLLSEEEFIPFDPPVVSKFGPISRDGKSPDYILSGGGSGGGSSMGVGGHSSFIASGSQLHPTLCRQATAPASTTVAVHHPHHRWLQYSHHGYINNHHHTQPHPQHPMQHQPLSRQENVNFITSSTPPNQHHDQLTNRMLLSHDIASSKELLIESQRMKQQLKTLEKKINDLKVASNGAALVEGEKLTQELHLIEQGIMEKEKVLGLSRTNSNSTLASSRDSWAGGYRSDEGAQEDSYEAGIANDIRELELRWEYELEEQEKRWSSEEESNKQH